VLSYKLASVYFIGKTVFIFWHRGNGQPRQPALCRLYQHTCVPYCKAAVHSRLRPRHPSHNGLVQSRRPPSSRIRGNQYDAAGALDCARRRNDVTRCNAIDMPPYGPLCANLTSSAQPEVHIVSQRLQGTTEPGPWVTSA